jgi:hypothetical protein
LTRADVEAVRVAAELAIQKDLDCFVSTAEAKMEVPSKAKPFIKAEVIAVDAKTTVENMASSGVAVGATRSP